MRRCGGCRALYRAAPLRAVRPLAPCRFRKSPTASSRRAALSLPSAARAASKLCSPILATSPAVIFRIAPAAAIRRRGLAPLSSSALASGARLLWCVPSARPAIACSESGRVVCNQRRLLSASLPVQYHQEQLEAATQGVVRLARSFASPLT